MTMAAAVVAHALAALKHHFIDRDVTLKRMLPLSTNITKPMNTIKNSPSSCGVAFAGRQRRRPENRSGQEHRHRHLQANERAGRRQVQEVHAAIDYDAGQAGRRQGHGRSETASMDLGDADYNKEVAKEWFNAAQFPKATFVSSSIKPPAPAS
jgi:uncharacterized protein with PIN domain